MFARGYFFLDRIRKLPKFSGASRQNIVILPLNMVQNAQKFSALRAGKFFSAGSYFLKKFSFFLRGVIFFDFFLNVANFLSAGY